ncbi:unnamed protein product [Allacma fusca]|uniref:DUF4817 domain-containing protein n=1 Tax=Allacma fusca TaxID=39272 RepID=A0A8J2P731_9HEXA|nr:unnamed protein product [Allacma fusca]
MARRNVHPTWRYLDVEKRDIVLEYRYHLRNGLSIHQAVIKTKEFYRENYPNGRCPCRETVLTIDRNFKDTGSVANKKPTGRPKTAQTPANIEKIKEKMEANHKLSTRRLARQMPISRTSCRRILKKAGYKKSLATKTQKLKPSDFPKRLSFCQEMLRRFADPLLFGKAVYYKIMRSTNKQSLPM